MADLPTATRPSVEAPAFGRASPEEPAFFQPLKFVAAHMRAERSRRNEPANAPRFNVFDFLRDDETGLSRIIAWLLDPAETHGQSDTFLRSFLEVFDIDVGGEDTRAAAVSLEAPTLQIANPRRRIDVKVQIGNFTFAIENKPWAGWQPGQVRAYLEQLAAEAPGGHCLVLVKGIAGDLPSNQLTAAERTAALEQGTLIDSDYGQLHTWAISLSQACAASRVRPMLEDFANHLLRTFGELEMSGETQRLAKAVLAEASLRPAAFDLLAAGNAILEELAELVSQQLRERIGPALDPDYRFDPQRRWAGPSIELDMAAPFSFNVHFDGYRLTKPYFGLQLREEAPTGSPYPGVVRDLRAAGSAAGKSSRWWVWWRWGTGDAALDRATDAQVWEAMIDGRFAGAIASASAKAREDLHRAGVLPWQPRRYRIS